MQVNGFADYGGLYNNYKVVDIPKVDIEAVKKQDEIRQAEKAAEVTKVELPVEEVSFINEPIAVDNRSRMADLDNISLTFNANDDYSFLGQDSDIASLDMEQAISDMHKDKILEDYNYFVGSSDNLKETFGNEDGKVFLKY